MTRKKNSYKIIGYAFLLLFYAHSSFSGEVYKTAILVNDAEKPDLVSSQIQKLLEEETGREMIFIGAKQLKEGTQSLQGLSSLICLIYGGNDKVSYFDEKVMEKIESFLESAIFKSRWFLAPFFLGLIFSILLLFVKVGLL